MPHEIVYPQGCRPINEELGSDELIRRLKVSSHSLLIVTSRQICANLMLS